MTTSSVTDPSGRQTVVQLHDDRGEPFKFVSNAVPLVGQSLAQEVISIPLTKDDTVTPKRPSLTRGQIVISAQVVYTLAIQYALADVTVIGYCGSTGTVIARAQLGAEAQIMRVTFEEDDTFDKIGIEALQIVDGQPSTNAVDVLQINLSAVAYMWS